MMRGIMLLLACALAVQAGHPPGGFVVNGTVDVPHRGRALLLADTDTVAVAAIADDGTFTMEGAATEVRLARIVAEGVWGSVELFLENGAVFDVTLGTVPKVEGGGREQRLAARFQEIGHRAAHRKNASGEGYFGALQRGDTATVRRIEGIFAEISLDAAREETELIRANPASFVSAYALYDNRNRLSTAQLEELTGVLDERLHVSKYVYGVVSGDRNQTGKRADDFTLKDTRGRDVVFSEFSKGKVVLLEFWASWCAPCRAANPKLEEIYRKYKERGFEILGISEDNDMEVLRQSIEKDGITFTNLLDVAGNDAVDYIYNLQKMPTNVLIDRNGMVVAREIKLAELENEILKLL